MLLKSDLIILKQQKQAMNILHKNWIKINSKETLDKCNFK